MPEAGMRTLRPLSSTSVRNPPLAIASLSASWISSGVLSDSTATSRFTCVIPTLISTAVLLVGRLDASPRLPPDCHTRHPGRASVRHRPKAVSAERVDLVLGRLAHDDPGPGADVDAVVRPELVPALDGRRRQRASGGPNEGAVGGAEVLHVPAGVDPDLRDVRLAARGGTATRGLLVVHRRRLDGRRFDRSRHGRCGLV